jgi:hypothetical protein
MTDPTQAPPPHVVVFRMLMGMWHAQILSAVAQLGVADAIAAGANDVAAIAAKSGANHVALQRLLNAALTLGVMTESSGKYALTPLGETLRDAVPGSLRDFVIAETGPGHWQPWGRLADAVRTGGPMVRETLGVDDAWEYYAQHPDEGRMFARAMSNLSALAAQEVARVYDPGDVTRVVDVGGSEGMLLRGILQRVPGARGILFDRGDVIDGARESVAASEFADRIDLVGGDFFAEVPAGGDLYLLKSILHDWPDDKCEEIVRTIHRSAPAGSRLLVVEGLLPDTPQPSPVTFMDLNMLVMLGGRERTAAEYRALLGRCGYEVERVQPTGGMFSVIEARRQ